MKRLTTSTLQNLSFSNGAESKDIGFLPNGSDLVCLSNSRWDAFTQAPQQRLSECLQNRRVFFIEEPVVEFIASWSLEISQQECGVWVVVPHLPNWVSDELITAMRQSLMDELFETYAIANPIFWYYTPNALSFTGHLHPSIVVYERVDDRSTFQNSSPTLEALEQQLLQRADIVLQGKKESTSTNREVVWEAQPLSAY
jgi:hypothetical protein